MTDLETKTHRHAHSPSTAASCLLTRSFGLPAVTLGAGVLTIIKSSADDDIEVNLNRWGEVQVWDHTNDRLIYSAPTELVDHVEYCVASDPDCPQRPTPARARATTPMR